MTEMITPYNRALTTPGMTGAWNFDTVPGLARVAKEILRQAMMIGYLNAFTMYTATSALAVVFALMVQAPQGVMRDRKRPRPSPGELARAVLNISAAPRFATRCGSSE